jgi:putative signal transducing protein
VYCPECRVEYREGFAECSDCLVSLVPDLPLAQVSEPEPEIDYVTVLETANPALLAVAKSLLRSAGIKHLVLGEGLQDIIGGGRLGSGNLVTGPVRIAVRRDNEAAAREFLQDLSESPDATELGSDESEIETEAPPEPSGRPWPRKWRLRAEAVVVVVVVFGLIDQHRTGTAGWWAGELAGRYVERSLDMEAARAQSPVITRLIPTWQSTPEDTAAWAASVYGKALKTHLTYDYPDKEETKKVQSRLAVTLAEFDRREAAAEALRALISTPPSDPQVDAFAKNVAQAYGLQGVPSGGDAQPTELAPGWSADSLEARSAQAIGDPSAAAAARDRIVARGAGPLKWELASTAIDILLTCAGLLALLRLILCRHLPLSPLQTPWTLQAGLWTVVLAYFWTFAGEYVLGFMRLPRGVSLNSVGVAHRTPPMVPTRPRAPPSTPGRQRPTHLRPR